MRNIFIPTKRNGYKPYLLRKTALVVYTILLLLVNSFGGLIGIPKAMASNITPENIISLTNKERQNYGLSSLSTNAKLSAAAKAKANNMFEEQYWDHYGPNGESPWMFITQSGYVYVYAGENLAKGFRTAEGVVEAWMASPTHKENIISPNYKDIGVAVVSGTLLGKETILVVQMFGNLTNQVETVKSVINNNSSINISESGEIKSISITSPVNNQLLNDAGVNIEGKVDNTANEYTVEVVEGSSTLGEVKSSESTWEYDKKSDWEEGDHSVYAKVKGTSVKSSTIKFTIDSTPPILKKENISVEHNENTYQVYFKVEEDCKEINIVSGARTISLSKNDGGVYEGTISKSDIGDKTVLMASDESGNISELDISEYFESGNSEEMKSNILLTISNSLMTSDGISIVIVSFVFLLLMIEVYVYWKDGKLGKHAGDLFTLGAWWLIIILGMFKGFAGVIN